jgi:hypothetical protein
MTRQNFLFTGLEDEEKYAEESYEDALNFKCYICGEKHYWEDMIFFEDGRTICKWHQ